MVLTFTSNHEEPTE